jgi:hypothetical protein
MSRNESPESSLSLERAGGCECGGIRYRVTGDPLAVTICHCTQCQRQSGSAFSMSLVVLREHFQLLRGEPRTFTTTSDSGARKGCLFCATCGVRIYNALERMPATVNVKPGTLDDTAWLAPQLEVWRASRQPWLELPELGPRFDGNPRRER